MCEGWVPFLADNTQGHESIAQLAVYTHFGLVYGESAALAQVAEPKKNIGAERA
ncbi:MAG: hypothetical protein WAO58_09065 [Fimbriimonadaceae bacterium]